MEKRPILGDLGGTRIRLCERGTTETDLRQVSDRFVAEFKGKNRFSQALTTFLDREKIDPSGRELRLSLPCDVKDNDFAFDNLSEEWNFNREEIRQKFGFSRVRAWNDAEAAFYALFTLMDDTKSGRPWYDIIQVGDGQREGRMILLAPGTGLGAVGAFLEDRNGKLFWLPVPSEFGSSTGWWASKSLIAVVRDMRDDNDGRHSALMAHRGLAIGKFNSAYFARREFLLSGPGLMRIYHSLAKTNMAHRPRDITQPKAIVQDALHGPDDGVAAETLRLFCEALAWSTIDLGLTFTARAGVFFSGSLLNAIGVEGLRRFGFLDALVTGRGPGDYPQNVPIYLIRHEYPELIGVGRFLDKPTATQL